MGEEVILLFLSCYTINYCSALDMLCHSALTICFYTCIKVIQPIIFAAKIHKRSSIPIMLTSPCNIYPPYTPLLYSKNGVYRGIRIFHIFALKHRLWVLVRTTSLRGGSNVYPQSMF